MYANVIEDVICDFVKNEVADKILLKKKTDSETFDYVHPEVYKGYIVAQNAEKTEEYDYPFIVVRVIKVFNGTKQNNSQRVYARVKILYGVWCEGIEAENIKDDNGDITDSYRSDEELTPIQDGSGHTDLWELMEKTRLEIFKRMVIGKKVTAQYEDFEMNIYEDQPIPQWHGYILLTVSMPEIAPSVSFKNVFGE